MKNKIAIIDTSILCCWLKVPGKETCGSGDRIIDFHSADNMIQKAIDDGKYLVLPLAVIIETGNHIAHAKYGDRYEIARELGTIMNKAADEESPWSAFTEQGNLWNADSLKKLAKEWPADAAREVSLGDATISKVADYYSSMGCEVSILSGDRLLESYVPAKPARIPRRRQRK